MNRKLIVSSGLKGQELLTTLLKAEDAQPPVIARNSSEVRRLLIDTDFDTVIIVTPLADEFGSELAIHVAENSSAGVLLIVKQEIADQVRNKVEDFGVFVVETPISKILFYQALKLVNVSRQRMARLKNENIRLQNKIVDIKTVDRAKCVLIQYLNMSEEQAHKYIEKQAMDRQMARKDVAESILRMYES